MSNNYEAALKAALTWTGKQPLFTEVGAENAHRIRTKAIQRFAKADRYPIAERFAEPYISIYEPLAMHWIPEFGMPYYLFFSSDPAEMLRFERVRDLHTLLRLVDFSSEFYITNENADYLITVDDEETLYTQGTAMRWLGDNLNRVYTLLGLEQPSPLLFNRVELLEWGQTIVFAGELKTSMEKQFTLTLTGCNHLVWDARINPYLAEVRHIYLDDNFTQQWKYYISMRTEKFLMRCHCSEIIINKGW